MPLQYSNRQRLIFIKWTTLWKNMNLDHPLTVYTCTHTDSRCLVVSPKCEKSNNKTSRRSWEKNFFMTQDLKNKKEQVDKLDFIVTNKLHPSKDRSVHKVCTFTVYILFCICVKFYNKKIEIKLAQNFRSSLSLLITPHEN